MSDGDQDVAVNVVNPSLSSRVSPPSLCSNDQIIPDTSSLSEQTCSNFDQFCENESKKVAVEESTPLDESEFDNERETDENEKLLSTDDTVINSCSENDLLYSSSSEENRKEITQTETMGNQSGKKKKDSDEDTPDESKTKCCEIPKKKLKDRNSKISKSSKSEENDFEDDEVYPFDIRTKASEQDDNDTVELEPFEIIETDDIKFIAGAGTSDVIRNASESKFKAIPEETCLDEEEELRRFEEDEETILKEASVCIDKGDRILESGTTTAHSTFEFRQVKPKGKLKSLREESQTVYENVDMAYSADSDKPRPVLSGGASHSSGSSKSNSSSSSKSSSRKNSKDHIPKPPRNGKKKTKDNENKLVAYENAEAIENQVEKKDVKLTETPKSTNAVILTQTMFSKPKSTKEKTEVRKASLDSQNTYENVNLCAILTPTGIVIGHRKSDADGVAGNVIHAANKPKGEEPSASSVMHDSIVTEDATSNNEMPQTPQVDFAIYETINSVSAESKPSLKKPEISLTSEKAGSSVESNRDRSALSERLHDENQKRKSNDKNVLQVEGQDESVPPPSPQGMEIVEEEEEEEDEGDIEETAAEHMNRKSAEIADFTENVCKRLSQLLETMPAEDDQTEDVDEDKVETDTQSIHIYEVIDAFRKDTDHKETVIETETPEMVSSLVRLETPHEIQRNDSSNTLKRTSGDSNTYPMTEFLGSSDDDLPEYFDPRKDSDFTTSTTKAEKAPAVSKSEEVLPKPTQRDNYVDMSVGWKTDSDPHSDRPVKGLQGLNLSQPMSQNSAGLVTDLQDITPTAEAKQELTALPEFANVEEESSLQYHSYGRQSVTYTESDLDISEHRDDLSTDSMLADDEDEETMEILFTKTYTEPEEGAEVFLSCTVVNTAYKEESKKSDTWLSDDALQYFEANAAEVMSTAFMKARKEMKDIQICIQNLRHQMEHFHGDCDDVSLPDMPLGSLSPDYLPRKAVTD